MQKRTSTLLVLALAAGLTGTATAASADEAGLTAAGLTSGGKKVTTFNTATGVAAPQVKLTGLDGDTLLVGLDYRPQNGALYGVGDAGGIYTVDPTTGASTFVDRLDVALDGTSFGVDFNPAANALRILSNTGQNLRHRFANLALPTVVDGTLNYGGTANPADPTTTAGSSTGGTLATGVTGAAYANNDIAPATGTTLYDLDTTKDVLATQNANPGILTAVGTGLGVDASDVAGFDITSPRTDGTATGNAAYAVLTVAGERGLYSIDLTTGTATFLTSVTRGVSDIAIAY